ncbi:hypothetical protein [uncultured Aquimarina sp.]|uniref:hypothetical protein n=1 Tax=uncultured Aquimarina sp. TaxID=575652 RepID=UPI002622DE02|nr:hypothetical protein [uncultured Aquimarina sp.]
MKTKLFYITSFILVFFTSCSVDENSNVQSINEKEIKIKSFLDAFSKIAVTSPSYSKLLDGIKTKSSSGLTAEEMTVLEQEFLSLQSPEFTELYNYIVDLNLSEDEIRRIVLAYLSDRNNNNISEIKSDECAFGEGGSGASSSILAIIISILCEDNKV